MPWVAVDKDGTERIYQFRPIRIEITNKFAPRYNYSMQLVLPKGYIKKLIGKDLAWEDDPVELKGE